MENIGEYAEAGPGAQSHLQHPSMSSAMNSTLSRIDQLMRDQERQYMTLPPFQNATAAKVTIVFDHSHEVDASISIDSPLTILSHKGQRTPPGEIPGTIKLSVDFCLLLL